MYMYIYLFIYTYIAGYKDPTSLILCSASQSLEHANQSGRRTSNHPPQP